ncbi:MAG: dihydrodipicolinate synthase family protein [Pyrinomonadaceae bacterium]
MPPPTNSDYTVGDIGDFCVEAARRIGAPLWLYRLRAHRASLTPESVLRIMARGGSDGIKDSSGGLEILEALTVQPHGRSAARILGDDSLLLEALRRDLCDQIISGVAGVLPELSLSISESFHTADSASTARRFAELAELIARLDQFPVPWGLKLIAELRGFAGEAYFPLPLTRERSEQVRSFQAWYQVWSAHALVNSRALRQINVAP